MFAKSVMTKNTTRTYTAKKKLRAYSPKTDSLYPPFAAVTHSRGDRGGGHKFSPMTSHMKGGRARVIDVKKDKRIKQNISKFKKIFKNVSPEKKEFVTRLYEKAAFMDATLEELQEQINEKGAVATYKNGNGFNIRSETPEQKAYNSMIKNFTAVMRTLADMAPEGEEDDELMQFLSGKKK